MRFVPWLVAIATGGIAHWAVQQQFMYSRGGMFLGFIDSPFVPENTRLGADDFAKGGAIVAGAVALGMVAGMFGAPKGVKV